MKQLTKIQQTIRNFNFESLKEYIISFLDIYEIEDTARFYTDNILIKYDNCVFDLDKSNNFIKVSYTSYDPNYVYFTTYITKKTLYIKLQSSGNYFKNISYRLKFTEESELSIDNLNKILKELVIGILIKEENLTCRIEENLKRIC